MLRDEICSDFLFNAVIYVPRILFISQNLARSSATKSAPARLWKFSLRVFSAVASRTKTINFYENEINAVGCDYLRAEDEVKKKIN